MLVMHKKIHVLLQLLLISLALPAFSTQTQAQTAFTQQQIGFSLSPGTSFVRIKPGSQATHTITIENTSQKTLSIQPQVVDFTADGTTGTPVLQSGSSFPYLTFSDGRTLQNGWDPIELKSGQKAQLTLRIAVPPLEKEKEWPLTVLFKVQNTEKTLEDNAAVIQPAIGSNLIVLVSNQEKLEQELSLIKAGTPLIVDSFKPLVLTPLVKNDQFAATVASGSAVLKGWSGKTIATQDFYPDIILGYSSRELTGISSQNSTVLQAGQLPDKQLLSFKPPLFFGLYTVEYLLYSPTGESQLIGGDSVLALPLLGVGVIIIMSIIGILFWRTQK
jgi:hypothetical protein